MKFQIIGTGINKVSKNGTGYIAIDIDPVIMKKVYPEDFNKFCLFKNVYKGVGNPDYRLMAPIREEIPQGLAQSLSES